MNRFLIYLLTLALMGLGLLIYSNPNAYALSPLATTTTIIGWNVPNTTTMGHGLVALILPIVTMGLFAAIPLIMDIKGKVVITMGLIGLLAGNLLGMMTITNTNATDISFAFVVISGLFLGLNLWKGD